LVIAQVEANRIVNYLGKGPCAAEYRRMISREPGLANIAELGLGVNPGAVVRGIVLEDEKVVGMHWAYGRSDHIGGGFGVTDFDNPEKAMHIDIVYPQGGEIEIASLKLIYANGESELVMRNGRFQVFQERRGVSKWVWITGGLGLVSGGMILYKES
jgi:leucyl aminopeptidase (aminopeptidase T)